MRKRDGELGMREEERDGELGMRERKRTRNEREG